MTSKNPSLLPEIQALYENEYNMKFELITGDKQLAVKTVTVIAVVIIIAAIVFVLDIGFEKGYEFVITKTSNAIQKDENKNQATNETTNETPVEEVNVEGTENVVLNQENQ